MPWTQKPHPKKPYKELCRLCGIDFPSKKNKHSLFLFPKRDYTLALEALTGPVNTTDKFTFICATCRTMLNRYQRYVCEVERIAALVKSISTAHAQTGLKLKTESKIMPKVTGETQNFVKSPPVSVPVSGAAVKREFITVVPVVWAASSVQAAVCSLKPTTPQPPLQPMSSQPLMLVPQVQPQPAVCSSQVPPLGTATLSESTGEPMRKKTKDNTWTDSDIITPTCEQLCLEDEGVEAAVSPIPSPPESPLEAPPPMKKAFKIIITYPHCRRSRIVKGPMELVLEYIVQGNHRRLPHAVMSVPGMFDGLVREVLTVVKKECKNLTSAKFKSVLRQISREELKEFEMTDVVAEWDTHAPTFLKFLEAACSFSTEASGSKSCRESHSDTKRGKMAMAGAMLLQARCGAMTAHMYRTALVMSSTGAKKRCFQRLNRLGVCVSDTRMRQKLKENAEALGENGSVDKEDTASREDHCQDNSANRKSDDDSDSDVISPSRKPLCSGDEEEEEEEEEEFPSEENDAAGPSTQTDVELQV